MARRPALQGCRLNAPLYVAGIIKDIEAEIVGRAILLFEIPLDTVLYDATNFFTFIASTNTKPILAARGHNKQKRDDLRQIGVALLCSRLSGIPLWHQVYGGQIQGKRTSEIS